MNVKPQMASTAQLQEKAVEFKMKHKGHLPYPPLSGRSHHLQKIPAIGCVIILNWIVPLIGNLIIFLSFQSLHMQKGS